MKPSAFLRLLDVVLALVGTQLLHHGGDLEHIEFLPHAQFLLTHAVVLVAAYRSPLGRRVVEAALLDVLHVLEVA